MSGRTSRGNNPAWCDSNYRTVIFSFPSWANSGSALHDYNTGACSTATVNLISMSQAIAASAG